MQQLDLHIMPVGAWHAHASSQLPDQLLALLTGRQSTQFLAICTGWPGVPAACPSNSLQMDKSIQFLAMGAGCSPPPRRPGPFKSVQKEVCQGECAPTW